MTNRQLRKSDAINRAYRIKWMYNTDNMSIREIADKLNISVATVHRYIKATKIRGVDVTDWSKKS